MQKINFCRSFDTTHEQSSRTNPLIEFCRLWRWPDLFNQRELKPVEHCSSSIHYSLDRICVNPFHYERVPSMSTIQLYKHLWDFSLRCIFCLRSTFTT